jgi:hypothetical protein
LTKIIIIIKYAIFAMIYCSAILGAVFFRLFCEKLVKVRASSAVSKNPVPATQSSGRFTFDLLDNSIMNGFEVVTRIGGYIILFSILAQIMKEIGPDSGVIKAFIMGTLEITTGVSQVCMSNINNTAKIVLVSALTSFGGFSGIAQTKSVLQDSGLSISSYIIVKIISALITTALTLMYVTFILTR